MKNCFCVLLMGFACVLGKASVAQSSASLTPQETKNSIGFKAGYHILQGSEFTDFYTSAAQALGINFGKNDLNSYVLALAYERKFMKYVGAEFAFEYAPISKSFSDILTLKIHSLVITPSVKGYLPLGEKFQLYAGVGPDICFALGKISFLDTVSDNKIGLGFHGLAGFDWFFLRPASDDYQAAVGFFIEYKYSWINIANADDNLIKFEIEPLLGVTFPAHDLNVGGHNIVAGLKWHF